MDNILGITPSKAAEVVKEMSILMNCDCHTAWNKYTHDIIKRFIKWEDISALL